MRSKNKKKNTSQKEPSKKPTKSKTPSWNIELNRSHGLNKTDGTTFLRNLATLCSNGVSLAKEVTEVANEPGFGELLA